MNLLRRKRSGGSSRSSRGGTDPKNGGSCAGAGAGGRKGPRLERHNAVRYVNYDVASVVAGASFSFSSSSRSSCDDIATARGTRSLDIPLPSVYNRQSSFRISGEGGEHEIEEICRNLGLSGPEEFSIPIAQWEAHKPRLPSQLKLDSLDPSDEDSIPSGPNFSAAEEEEGKVDVEDNERHETEIAFVIGSVNDESVTPRIEVGQGGIRGVRPPALFPPQPVNFTSVSLQNSNGMGLPLVLKPPPVMCLPTLDKTSSAWDIVRSFAPVDEAELREFVNSDEDEEISVGEVVEEVVDVIEKLGDLRLGDTVEDFTGLSSYSTVNDDDSSSTTTDATVIVSPNGLFKTKIESWSRGALIGEGSYGTVYEAISEEGVFFAVKEVSLIDQGSNAQQCIDQLEQEIALLSQLEHENIVKYHGTDRKEAKLFIFLELVAKGSLASLYQQYCLQDSHVSAYTRQILNGLSYLHDRNVVHRDIKCANILVHANGSVKLADFGLAREMTNLSVLKSCKGSVYWMAPEVVDPTKSYGSPADIWSLGCTVLEMLTREIPYPNVEWMKALYKIGQGEQPPIPDHLSRDARDFIRQCVRVNPNDRPTAAQLLDHPFVKR